MARPRKWGSDAERKRAQRGGGELEGELVAPVADDFVVLPVGRVAPPVEEYVADARLGARLDAERRLAQQVGLDGLASPQLLALVEERVGRAELYARWRHAGFVAGEISGL